MSSQKKTSAETSNKTNPEKVKQQIQEDLKRGQGDITAREAGGRRE